MAIQKCCFLVLLAALGLARGIPVHAAGGPIPNVTYLETQDPNRLKFVYMPDGTTDSIKGCLGYPKGIGPFRTVIIVHGPDGDAMKVGYNYAPLLLDRGYAFIAIDLKYAPKPEESDFQEIFRHINIAMDIIKGDEKLDEDKVFIFGNGPGAMVALAYAAQSDKLKAVAVSGSGQLPKDGLKYEKISAPVLLVHGATDETVPLESAMQLKSNLERAGNKVETKVFDKSGHEVIMFKSKDAFDVISGFFNKYAK